MTKLVKRNEEMRNTIETFEARATCSCACVCSCSCQPSYGMPTASTKSSGTSSDKSSYLSSAKNAL